MKNLFKLGFIFVIVIGYIFLINIFANLISFSNEQMQISQKTIGGTSVKVGVSQSVSVQVTRKPRWWGSIKENNGKAYLNLFYLIKLPHKIEKYNFWIFHIFFLVIFSLSIILIFTKKKVYKEENHN